MTDLKVLTSVLLEDMKAEFAIELKINQENIETCVTNSNGVMAALTCKGTYLTGGLNSLEDLQARLKKRNLL